MRPIIATLIALFSLVLAIPTEGGILAESFKRLDRAYINGVPLEVATGNKAPG
jgi:hypothetical protein